MNTKRIACLVPLIILGLPLFTLTAIWVLMMAAAVAVTILPLMLLEYIITGKLK